jgi:cobalamin synthase
MLRRVALVITDVSEKSIASVIRVTRIGELGTLVVTSSSMRQLLVTADIVPSSLIGVTLVMEVISSSETSALTRATRSNIPGDGNFHSHCRKNLISYIVIVR